MKWNRGIKDESLRAIRVIPAKGTVEVFDLKLDERAHEEGMLVTSVMSAFIDIDPASVATGFMPDVVGRRLDPYGDKALCWFYPADERRPAEEYATGVLDLAGRCIWDIAGTCIFVCADNGVVQSFSDRFINEELPKLIHREGRHVFLEYDSFAGVEASSCFRRCY